MCRRSCKGSLDIFKRDLRDFKDNEHRSGSLSLLMERLHEWECSCYWKNVLVKDCLYTGDAEDGDETLASGH